MLAPLDELALPGAVGRDAAVPTGAQPAEGRAVVAEAGALCDRRGVWWVFWGKILVCVCVCVWFWGGWVRWTAVAAEAGRHNTQTQLHTHI